ncbi:RHS repeat-associated core domain-containing protein [Reinekea marina]|nr:RHS repeat-associated core domain-containing protein [Reinekea marina]MDN3649147.1 RHS repeat-associated core domain-containing protein [Reinekea marina]
MIKSINPGGQVTQYQALDALGRAQRLVMPDNRVQSYDYNFRGQTTAVTLPDGFSQTRIGYNSRGEKEHTVDPTGLEQAWSYSGEGRLVRTQNLGNPLQGIPGLNATEYQYTPLGALAAVTNAEFETTEYLFNANGTADGYYDAANTFFDINTDSLGRTTLQADAYNQATTTEYEQGGRVVKMTDALGNVTTVQYNAFGELISVIDAENNERHFAYNERGEQIAQWDDVHGCTNVASAGCTGATQLNNPQYFAYNTRGQITTIVDAHNRTTRMDYSAAGNLAEITQPNASTTYYDYDAANRLTGVTSANGFAANDPRFTQNYTFDANGYLDTATNELGLTTDYDIDPAGRLNAITQPSYDRIDYQYNALGQMTQRIANGDATTQESWAFDQVGRLSQITNAHYKESYQYTKRGTLDKVTNHTLNQTIDYTDDLNGRRIGLATDLTQVSYERDASGRIHTLTTQEDRFEFGYDNLNRMVTKTSTNGTRDVKLYNERGDIIAIAFQRPQTSKELKKGQQYGFDTQLFDDYQRERKAPNYADLYSFENHLYQVEQQLKTAYPENGYVLTDLIVYQWNEVGNLMAKYDASEKTQNSYFYDYDAADRLTQAFEGKYTTVYNWDANGNLESKTQQGKTFVYTYNEANQLTHAREWERDDEDDDDHDDDEDEYEWDDRVDTQYQYSRNGELTQTTATDDDNDQHTTQYNSDAYGRLIAIIGDNQDTLTFAYDSRDRRILSAFQGWVREDDDDDDHNEDWEDDDRDDEDNDNKKGKNNTKLPTGHNAKNSNYVLTSLFDGRQELAQYATSAINQADYQAYRQLTYLPNQVAGLYGQLLSQNLYQAGNKETKVSGHLKGLQAKLYFHSDYQNSTLRVSGIDSQNNYGFRYNAFGVVTSQYRNDDDNWDDDDHSASSIHTRTNNLIPYQYTGKYRESISGLNQMDARWYNPKVGRFIQPDQYNHVNLMLPKGAQSELMRYIGRTQSDLLKDPAQQMRYGYVSGNALRWVDPLGLCEPEDAGYVGAADPKNQEERYRALLKENYDIYNLAKADWKQGVQDHQDPYVKMIDSFSKGDVGQGLWQATKNIAVEGAKGGGAYIGLRGSNIQTDFVEDVISSGLRPSRIGSKDSRSLQSLKKKIDRNNTAYSQVDKTQGNADAIIEKVLKSENKIVRTKKQNGADIVDILEVHSGQGVRLKDFEFDTFINLNN